MRTCIDLDRLGVSSFRSCRGFNNIFIILDFDFYIHVSFKVVPYFSTYRSNCGISLRFETSCTYRILFNKAKIFSNFKKIYAFKTKFLFRVWFVYIFFLIEYNNSHISGLDFTTRPRHFKTSVRQEINLSLPFTLTCYSGR